MKRAIAIIAATAVLAPVATTAQSQDQTVRRHVVVTSATQAERRVQQRTRDEARARAEQVRRDREQATDKSTRTLKIGTDGAIEISNLSGDITIRRGGSNAAQLEIVKIARGRTMEEAKEALGRVNVQITERDSRARISTHYSHIEDRGRRQTVNVSVQYTLTAPENTRISANTLSGNVTVTDIKGDLNLVTVSGDVTVNGGARVMTAKSTSGKIELINLRSEVRLDAETVSGDVILRQSQLPRVELSSVSGSVVVTDVRADRIEAETLSGNVQFQTPLVRNGRYELTSHSGTITLIPTGDVGFDLEVDTFSGAIQTQVSLKDQETEEGGFGRRGGVRSISGTYGDGGATMEITTFSGRVVIGKR
ncbi:MAG TPA: DUF4097 family beta strand repeat-containing protein [Vicinamibacterales bacterium]